MRVQEVGYRTKMTAEQLKQAEIQLVTALKTQLLEVALDISFYRDTFYENWEAQKEYWRAIKYLYYLLTL
jgi:hypothetical protein